MNPIFPLILLLIPIPAISLGQNSIAEKEKQAVFEVSRRLESAYLQGKWEVAESMLAEDYIGILSSGRFRNKSDELSAIKEFGSFPESIRPSPIISTPNMVIRIYSDVAIITGKSKAKQQYSTYEDLRKKKPPIEIVDEVFFTTVWVKRDNRWQLVSAQDTRVAPRNDTVTIRAYNNAMQPTRISVPLIDNLAVPQLCARG